MTLRKTTVDNSVRYIPKSEQTKEKEIKPKTTKSGCSLLRKQNKKLSPNKKNGLLVNLVSFNEY